MATEEKIRALAYTIWEQEGCPEGKREEHYYRAKQILEEQQATSRVNFEPPPPVINLATTPQEKEKPYTPQESVGEIVLCHINSYSAVSKFVI